MNENTKPNGQKENKQQGESVQKPAEQKTKNKK